MAQQFDNTNKGVLFNNADQKQSPSHPDYKGSINIEGVEYWISGWIKPMAKDPAKRFLSLSAQPKQAAAPAPPARAPQRPVPAKQKSGFDDFDDEPAF